MDNRAIGIFDSGLGGLTAAKELEQLLPGEDLVYFGDSGRSPYGGRTAREMQRISCQNAAFLSEFDVKAILVACGTSSATSLPALRERISVPFFGVIDASCAAAARESTAGRVAVIATQAAIASGLYEKRLLALRPGLEVISLACPGFAPLVESGGFGPGEAGAAREVEAELAPLKGRGIDTLLLGCTHFPLLSTHIAAFLGEEIRQISCGQEAARELAAYLAGNGALADRREQGRRQWFTSGDTERFAHLARLFLRHEIKAQYHEIV